MDTGSGESSGKGTGLAGFSSPSRLMAAAEVSIERARELAGHEDVSSVGPSSPEGLPLGLALALSDESSSPTRNLGRPRLRVGNGGPWAAIERGMDASGVSVAASVSTGAGLGFARRGSPRRGLWAPGPRSVEKLSMLADWVRV